MVASPLPWIPPSSASLGVFLAIVAFVCGTFLWVAHHSHGRAGLVRGGLGLAAWLGLTVLAAESGALEAGLPFTIGLFMGTLALVAIGLTLSPAGRVASGAPLAVLVGFQGFRLPLELVLHRWAEAGVIPVSMSWSGQNLDVVAGVTCAACGVAIAVLPARARAIAWVGNVVGFVLLLNVMRVAVQSSPGPLRIFGDPPLMLVFHAPTVWIASVCVCGALLGHLVTFRRLLGR
ncbi:MAG: hypothetical protein H6737_08380 [Alphaproteobacteria bacterium]|nr:hypothetical protein [Alphaproteobacteria bacterium]